MQTFPTMDCCQAYKLGWQNYAKCDGRSRRSEYWYFALGNLLVLLIPESVFIFTGLPLFLYIAMILSLFMIIPNICVGVRRLHDTGRPGFYLLFAFIPLVGAFILLYFFALDSEESPNMYGPSPKYIQPQSGTLINNNYVQPNIVAVPVNPYPQPNPIPPQVVPYPQPNPTPYTGQPIPPPQGFAPY